MPVYLKRNSKEDTRACSTSTRLLQTLTDALSLGSLYALIAIGYTMVYGVLRLINFAHGEIFMIAMYIVFYGISMFSLPWYVTFAVTILVTALLGTLAERLAYRPLAQRAAHLHSDFRDRRVVLSAKPGDRALRRTPADLPADPAVHGCARQSATCISSVCR